MALMLHRETNQVKWIGTRPGHNGEQVVKSNNAINATSIVHTVTAGKTFYLCLATFCLVDAVGAGMLFVRNGADVAQYTIIRSDIETLVGSTSPLLIPFNPPIEIPASWDICVEATGVGCNANGFVFGWEE